MQSGKFFSNDVLRELGILNEDFQVNEDPQSTLKGLGKRASTFFMSGDKKKQAEFEIAYGKVAQRWFKEFNDRYVGDAATADNVIQFLTDKLTPYGDSIATDVLNVARSSLGQTAAQPTNGQQPNFGNLTATNPSADAISAEVPKSDNNKFGFNSQSGSTIGQPKTVSPETSIDPRGSNDYEITSQDVAANLPDNQTAPSAIQTTLAQQKRSKFNALSDPDAQTLATPKPVRENQEINKILRLSGLKEIIFEQALAKELLDKVFLDVAKIYYTRTGDKPPSTPQATPAANTTDQTSSASALSGDEDDENRVGTPSRSYGRSGRSDSTSSTTDLDPKVMFTNWLRQNQNNKKLLNFARSEIEKVLNNQDAATAAGSKADGGTKVVRFGGK